MAGIFDNGDQRMMTTARPDPLLGRVLAGRYDIIRLLGQGGMGRVYEGRQRALDRPVAVKCIHRHFLTTEQLVVRFLEEARVASQLVHPNIVKIYDFGRTDGPEEPTFFLVMELLAGPQLSGVILREAPVPLARTYSIIAQILSALGEAHAHGVTHRDAKPDNIVLEPVGGRSERVKIIDFGVAKVHGSPGVTSAGQFVGTPHYMPPEQIRGDKAEVSSDLYAAGVTLFQLITGRLPFDADTVTGVLEQQLYARRPDPRDFVGEACPDSLADVCSRALHVDPAERYPNADAFTEAVAIALSEVLPAKSLRHPYSQWPSDVAWPRPPASTPRQPLASEVPRELPSDPASSSPGAPGRAFAPTRPHLHPPSSPPRRASSVPPRAASKLADLSVAERIEQTADAELRAGRLEGAASELRRGLALGRCWIEAGDLEIGGAALTAFGRKLGALTRDSGRLEESERVLRAALEYTEPEELGRARVLVELAATLAERGLVGDAEALRVEALRIAATGGDRELTTRLRRMAQSFAIAVATRRPVSDRPRPDAGVPPRRSDWRVRSSIPETDGEPRPESLSEPAENGSPVRRRR